MSNELVVAQRQQQQFREIVLWSQRDNTDIKVSTDAVTWGQLKTQNKHDFNFENIRGVVKSNSHVLELDDALLPTEDCLIFLFPKKVSSGMRTKEEYIKTCGYKELRTMCTKRGLGSDGTKVDFAERLAADDEATAAKTHVSKPDVTKPSVHKTPATKGKTESLKEEPPVTEVEVVPVKETAIAPVPANVGFATVEDATVSTTMKVRINDVTQLASLLEVMFPAMEVVKIDAMVDLTAELKLDTVLPKPVGDSPIGSVEDKDDEGEMMPTGPPPEKKPKKKFVVPSREDMKREAKEIAKQFKK